MLDEFVDQVIGVVDTGLRTLTQRVDSSRMPFKEKSELSDVEQTKSRQLLRVNHTGEVCAQALYEGQSLTARSDRVRQILKKASEEEEEHLAWCRNRLDELGGSPSLLNPFFYFASAALGAATGLLGDKLSLGFVEATEDQVCEHLDRHLVQLPASDERSQAILRKIRDDESRHGENALKSGGTSYPSFVRNTMTVLSRVMTETTKRI